VSYEAMQSECARSQFSVGWGFLACMRRVWPRDKMVGVAIGLLLPFQWYLDPLSFIQQL